MKQFIYLSEFNTGPEATKKQQILFEADLSYAISEEYRFIQTKSGDTFEIDIDGNKVNLIEVEVTEEELQALNAEPTEVDFDPEFGLYDEDYCVSCHNLMLIDDIINNTLIKEEDITPQQADTMLKLAKLKEMLGGN
jgi:hypothetical protein